VWSNTTIILPPLLLLLLLQVLGALGLEEELKSQGGGEGDVLLIGDMERPLVYSPSSLTPLMAGRR